MAQEVAIDSLGDEFKGYVVRITGGNDVRRQIGGHTAGSIVLTCPSLLSPLHFLTGIGT